MTAQQEAKPEADRETVEGDRRTRTRRWLNLATPLAAMLLTLLSALAKLLIGRLPTLQPIVIVLLVFFVVLGVSALLQLYLHWRDLRTEEAR